jgi:hypothetical protein
MDHTEAIHMQAAERYVLGDLSVSEVEEFERHFFDCSQCSEELRMLAILQDNARAAFLEPSPTLSPVSRPLPEAKPERAGWRLNWIWAPAFAALIAAVFGGYEFGARQSGNVTPQSIAAYPLYAASRGDETVIAPSPGARFYSLYMDRTWDRDFASYRAVFRDGSGAERFSLAVPAPSPGRAIYILAPATALAAGKYSMIVLGRDSAGQETEAARYPFTLRLE